MNQDKFMRRSQSPGIDKDTGYRLVTIRVRPKHYDQLESASTFFARSVEQTVQQQIEHIVAEYMERSWNRQGAGKMGIPVGQL